MHRNQWQWSWCAGSDLFLLREEISLSITTKTCKLQGITFWPLLRIDFPLFLFLRFFLLGTENIQQQHLNTRHKEWWISALEITASMRFLSWWWMMDTRNTYGIFSSCVHQIPRYKHNTIFSCTWETHWNHWRNRKNAGWVLLLGSCFFSSNMTKFNVKDMKPLAALHSWV